MFELDRQFFVGNDKVSTLPGSTIFFIISNVVVLAPPPAPLKTKIGFWNVGNK